MAKPCRTSISPAGIAKPKASYSACGVVSQKIRTFASGILVLLVSLLWTTLHSSSEGEANKIGVASDHGAPSIVGIAVQRGDPPLVVTMRSAVAEAELKHIEVLIDEVEANGNESTIKQRRAFGTGDDYEAGHEVTYLHQYVSTAITDLFWKLAVAADAQIPAWNIVSRVQAFGRPALRCLEAISYYSKPESAAVERLADPSGLSWHHDGATLFTVVVALHTAGADFDGGELEFRDHSQLLRLTDLHRGDVVVWRGWDFHRVRPIGRGRRTVVVAEWWLGQRCSAEELRPIDSEDITRQTIDLDNSSSVLHEILADHQTERMDDAGADETWKRVLEIDPLHVRAHYNRGKLMDLQGDNAGAMRSYAEALRIDGRYGDAHTHQGMLYARQGNLREAAESYKRAIWVDPNNADAHHDFGIVMGSMGNLTGAQESFRIALSIDFQHAGAHYNLGCIQENNNDLAAAEGSFRAALRTDPQDPDAQERLGNVLRRMRMATSTGLAEAPSTTAGH